MRNYLFLSWQDIVWYRMVRDCHGVKVIVLVVVVVVVVIVIVIVDIVIIVVRKVMESSFARELGTSSKE